MNLLSEKDLRTLEAALDTGMETDMTRSLGDITVTARTRHVKPPWLVHTILQVRIECGNVTALQNFVSVEEMRRLWKEW